MVVVAVILIVSLLICFKSIGTLRKKSQRINQWHERGVDLGFKAEEKDILLYLGNMKLPEQKNIQSDEEQGIVISLDDDSYHVKRDENDMGNTIVRFVPNSLQKDSKKTKSVDDTKNIWLYEYFRDEVFHTSDAEVFYKESNRIARRLLLGGITSVACVVILLVGLLTMEDKLTRQVMNSCPDAYPHITYKEAFESFWAKDIFHKPSWIMLEDEQGNVTMTFRGQLRADMKELVCEEIEIVLGVDEYITIKSVVIYGDLESIIIPYKRNLNDNLSDYAIEFLFEYAQGLEEGEPTDPLSYAFVKMVQRSSIEDYPDVIVGEALDVACQKSHEWKYFCSDLGEDIVEFNGNMDGLSIKMQFKIDEDYESYELAYMEVDGESFTNQEAQFSFYSILATQSLKSELNDYTSGETDEWFTMEQILDSYNEKYGAVSYAMYDMDAKGSEVLLVNYGETEADKVTEVYLPNVSTGEYIYSGFFAGDMILYKAEGDVGIYAVKGQQGVEWLYHITIEEGSVCEELLSEKLLGANETYYENDNPILFTEY